MKKASRQADMTSHRRLLHKLIRLLVTSSFVIGGLVFGKAAYAAEQPDVISVVPGDAQVTLSFSKPTDAPNQTGTVGFGLLGYRIDVYGASTLLGTTQCAFGATATESCVVTSYRSVNGSVDLLNGTNYQFEVIAEWRRDSDSVQVDSEPSERTEEVSPFTTPAVPVAPTALVDESLPTTVAVSWIAPANNGNSIDEYNVEVWDKGGNAKLDTIAGCVTAALTCDVSGLSYGTGYTFKVSATNDAGNSEFSPVSNALIIIPNQPTGLQLTRLSSPSQRIRVTWNAPANNVEPISSYTVAFTPQTGTAVQKSTTDDSREIDFTVGADGDIRVGVQYSVTVFATNDGGDGVESQSSQITPSTAPGAPTGVSSTISTTNATVTWLAPSNNGGENISEYTAQAFPTDATDTSAPLAGLSCISTSRLSCTISGLAEGSRYKFAVKAKNQNNDYGAWSVLSAQSDVVPISIVPNPPTPPQTPVSPSSPISSPTPVGGSSAPSPLTPSATPPAAQPSPFIGSLVSIRKKPPSKSIIDLNIAVTSTRVQFRFIVPKSKSAKTQVTRYTIILTPAKQKGAKKNVKLKAVTKNVKASAEKVIDTTVKVTKGATYSSTVTILSKDGKRSTWKGPLIVVPK